MRPKQLPRGGSGAYCALDSFVTARRNARIASVVLATAIPSVRLSVTRRYCVKTTARSTVQFALLDSKMCLVLYKPKIFPSDLPSPANGILWEMSELITQERIAVGSSNLVEGLIT